ncbi:hypothetical protein AAHA92_17899 [Salvia divinorum]|uniref:Uncharacterized protein n=1 Tax=Salvia divinorum TaxID=28513 RepID=A0ABD1H0C2_SALDI
MEESKPVPQTRKRHLLHEIQDSPCYKMRGLLKDLRPHFIEVLKTPDFRNCKAADDIRQGMKLLMELYQEMTENSVKLKKCSNGDVGDAKKAEEHQQDADNPLLDDVMSVPLPDSQVQGTYIVGGSAFGWNFITYNSSKAVYYGLTKEAFRVLNPLV